MGTKIETNTLGELSKIGQSPWYDNIDRRLIKSDELKKLFASGILGVTSNPTIFEKAVSASDVYDEEIKRLAGEGKNTLDIYNALTIEDVKDAARLLQNTYEETRHIDGYVSIEVEPSLAHNPSRTIDRAREIFNRIDMPNIMIKVPGTKEAPDAIRALTREGINVNMTLLFSVEHYETNALAYIAGLKDRLREGKSVKNIFSVASIFISRIDTKVDKILADIQNGELQGEIAVANSKMIYQKFRELFESSDFRQLKSKGANLQRVLWASTSTKNPAYSDVKYVEELIGQKTVNTLPPQTVKAFLDHGKVELTVEKELDKARSCLAQLKSLGIDIDQTCQEIQDDGVKAFQDSFDNLIHAIESKK